jgi:hypothetical protein
MGTISKIQGINTVSKISLLLVFAFFSLYSCTKEETNGDYAINNSLTIFKIDNKNNDINLASTDTVASQSGVNGKFIPVSGSTGSSKGLDTIKIQLFTTGDSLLNSVTLTSFFKPEYHVINTQLTIPASQKGKVYKVAVKVIDKTGATVGTKTFYGVDVVSCDPLPPCIVNNQITVIVETPPNTPAENIYLFGSINGWNRSDTTYKLHKNPEVPNCYCITVPFPPGSGDWQLGEIFVTRGLFANDAVKTDNSNFTAAYSTTERGPIWKIRVPKWRDK